MPRRIRTEDVWPDNDEEATAAPQGIADRLRSSAENWRGLASVLLVLGVIGTVVGAVFLSEAGAGVVVGFLVGSVLALALGLGLFFMASLQMEGLAELLDRLPAGGGARGHRSSAAAQKEGWREPSGPRREHAEPRDEDRLVAPLQAEVERMRQVGLARGYEIVVTGVSPTEAIVDTGLGRFRVTIGDDGQAKVNGA